MENNFFHGQIQESVNNLKERLKEIRREVSGLRETYIKDRSKYIEEITELKTKVKFIAGVWGALVSLIVAIASIGVIKLIAKFFPIQ